MNTYTNKNTYIWLELIDIFIDTIYNLLKKSLTVSVVDKVVWEPDGKWGYEEDDPGQRDGDLHRIEDVRLLYMWLVDEPYFIGSVTSS